MASSKNAIKHGLTARGLLPDEDADEFDGFARAMRAQLRPVGPLDDLFADRIISTAWRLRRVPRVEAGLLTATYFAELTSRAEVEVTQCTYGLDDLLRATERQVTDPAGHAAASAQLTEVREMSRCAETEMGLAFARRAAEDDGLAKVTRYEVSLERSLIRLIHEFERLRAARAKEAVQVPTEGDIPGTATPTSGTRFVSQNSSGRAGDGDAGSLRGRCVRPRGTLP